MTGLRPEGAHDTGDFAIPTPDMIAAHRALLAAYAATIDPTERDALQVKADLLASVLCARLHDGQESDEDGQLVKDYWLATDGTSESLGLIDALPLATLQAVRGLIAP